MDLFWHEDVEPALQAELAPRLERAAMGKSSFTSEGARYSTFLFRTVGADVIERVKDLTRSACVLAIGLGPLDSTQVWELLAAGAADVLSWPELPEHVEQVAARFDRYREVRAVVESERVQRVLIGESPAWRALIWEVVQTAAFAQLPVLVLGESGTGKELLAQLIHDVDRRPNKHELVVVDCTTLRPELSGSELFGHERGAFTGALTARDGACARAHGGSLFLDEVGELPLELQAQLLRVIQEHKYKRIGSNVWQAAEFRLICATHRDLEQGVADGTFRRDLYYRIAGAVVRTPPLRERKCDILPLATHFLEQCSAPLQLDDSVREYLLARDYPGNVRELQRVVSRLAHRHVGPGPMSAGCVPPSERPPDGAPRKASWQDAAFEHALRHALALGVSLREISQAATDTAIRLAVEHADGNLQRAASQLGVTDRALQLRRATRKTAT